MTSPRAVAAFLLGSATVAVALWFYGWGAVALVIVAELAGMLWQASQGEPA